MATLSAETLSDEGMRYLNGDGVKNDEPRAVELFEQAIALGSTKAKRALAYVLFGDMKSAWDAKTEDEKRGVQLYEEAAAEGDKQAKEWYVLQFATMTPWFKFFKGQIAKDRAALAKKYLIFLWQHYQLKNSIMRECVT